MQVISLGPGFDAPVNGLPANLTKLSLTGLFNQELKGTVELQHLTLGFYFNQPLQGLRLPNLLSLTLGHDFHQSWDGLAELMPQLLSLNFGGVFPGHVILPKSLETLALCKRFNQSLEILSLPENLQELILAGEFNQTLQYVSFPQLKSLTLAGEFNQSVEEVKFPSSLEDLKFGFRFNQALERVVFPQLRHLTFGHEFNQSLDSACFPDTLQSLTFGWNFNHRLVKLCKLKSLTLKHFFNQSFMAWAAFLFLMTSGQQL